MATNELQILFLRLKNYRQYYGDQKIDLSSEKNNINIIQGENGEGKSNILNAINYCLYLQEPHLKSNSQQMPIINTRAIEETKTGNEVPMEVELELGNKDVKYRISRKISAKKRDLKKTARDGMETYEVEYMKGYGLFPKGLEPFMMDDFKIAKRGQSDWEDRPIESAVRQLLPDELRSFYFLDGEFLESLHATFSTVQKGVEEISHLSIVMETIDHLHKVLRILEKQTQGVDANADKLLEEMHRAENWLESKDDVGNSLFSENPNDIIWSKATAGAKDEYHHETGRPRLKSKKQEAEYLREKIREIDGELQKHNSQSVQDWSTELEKLSTKTIPEADERLRRLKKEKMEYMVRAYLQSYTSNPASYTHVQLLMKNVRRGSFQ